MESLSHDVFVGDFGDLIHLEVSGGLDVPDGHCHADDGVVGVGAGVVAGNLQFGFDEFGVDILGFTTTLLGQDKFGGLLALYFGVVGVGVLRSEEFLGATLL